MLKPDPAIAHFCGCIDIVFVHDTVGISGLGARYRVYGPKSKMSKFKFSTSKCKHFPNLTQTDLTSPSLTLHAYHLGNTCGGHLNHVVAVGTGSNKVDDYFFDILDFDKKRRS
jgi:hypothetical protein